MKRFLYISLCVLTVILTGCEGANYNYNSNGNVARLRTFSFAKNDSMPGLAAAVFTIDERNDTGLVWNKDSIRYGTRLDSVSPRYTFAATPSAAWITTPDTTCLLTGYDTLNFTKQPIYLTIVSSDRTVRKTYEIRATVHQTDPDLYSWVKLHDNIYPADNSEQQVLTLNNTFVLIKTDGASTQVYQSADGINWTDLGEPNNLPAQTKVRQIISDGQTLYYAQTNQVYTSNDAITWTAMQTSYPVYTILMYWNERVWALIDKDGYELAYIDGTGLNLLNTPLRPKGEFPVSDFAAVCFESSSLRKHAMIIGGRNANGQALNTRWSLEHSTHPSAQQGTYRMQEFSAGRTNFNSIANAAVVHYKNQLLLFGGMDANGNIMGEHIMVSTDEGLNWTKADSTKNRLPETYRSRCKQTAIVRDNCIYLFGGQDAQTTYSDVCKGRLNSIDW